MEESAVLDLTLAVEAAEGDRWRVRVDVRPLGEPVSIMGATVALLDMAEELLGPAVVLPLAGSIADHVTVHARVPAPPPRRHPASVRCTVFFTDRLSPFVADKPIERPIGFASFVRGDHALGLGTPPPGRSLSEEEKKNLGRACPWLGVESAADVFDAFSKDFADAFDVGDDKDVTEEILRMLGAQAE